MRVLEGKSVFSGIAIGKISILQKADTSVKRTKVENPEAEITRVQEAKEKAVEQLQKLYDKALREVGESGAAIFEVHQMMLDDEDYLDSIDNIIRTENVNAEYAVATTGDNFADMFAQMDDDYMKARAADVKDISDRLVRVLSGHDEGDMDAAEPSIIVAEDLAPSETVQMDKSKVLAFVTRKGSSNSHTAILARTMNIPALINIEYEEVIPIPCPHFKISIEKRSQGQSAVAGVAYQSGERLFSEYDQKTKFYNKKKELVHAEIMLPLHAPPGYADRATLWNAVEVNALGILSQHQRRMKDDER